MRKFNLSIMAGMMAFASLPTNAQSVIVEKGYANRQIPVMRSFGTQVPTNKLFASPRKEEVRQMLFTPDWVCQFNTEGEFNWFTVIDANNDASEMNGDATNKWTYRSDSKCAWYYCWTNTTDDWLVTPGMNLRAGKKYTLSFKTTIMSTNFTAEMEVKYGKTATVEGLDNMIIDKVETTGMGYEETKVEFTPESDGVYYIGFHLTNVNYLLSFYLDDVKIEGEAFGTSPAAVTDLKATSDPAGAAKAEISFTLPEKTVDGNADANVNGIKIKDGETVIADIKDITGSTMTYTTGELTAGYHTFTVIPYNDVDEGVGTSVTEYIGLDIPSTPQNFKLSDGDDHIIASWEASKAEHDGVFFPEGVTYNIHNIETNEYNMPCVGSKVGSVKDNTTMDINISTSEGNQYLKDFVMNAENEAGESPNFYRCGPILLGKPYASPFLECFDKGKSTLFWMNAVHKTSAYGSATNVSSNTSDGFDSTPGCVALTAQNPEDYVYFYSGKISLAGTTQPKIAFKMKSTATAGKFYVCVKTPDGEVTNMETINLAENTDNNNVWQTKIFDLSSYAAERYVQIGFTMDTDTKANNNTVLVDHVFVGDMADVDLAVELIAPRSVVKGETAPLAVRIDNNGCGIADTYTVKVYAGEEVIYDKAQNALPALETANISIDYNCNLLDIDDNKTIKVVVAATGDNNVTDNSAEAEMKLNKTEKSPTTGLTAETKETAENIEVKLTWNPAPNEVPKTDDFENYNPWATYQEWTPNAVGDWSMIDGDEGYCWGFNDMYWYGSERSQFAFTVFNPYKYSSYPVASLFEFIVPEAAKPFIPYSGDQYLAALYSGDVVMDPNTGEYVATIEDADNWLISPEQDGRAQEISFFVNNYAGLTATGNIIDHVETFEVLYSTTGKERESFTVIGEDRQATGGEWQEVRVQLPEGTKYFAIHHKSKLDNETGSPFIFMIDDVSVMADNYPVKGYKLYRDGQLIAETKDTYFTDHVSVEGDYLYQVTVVYEDGGESIPVSLQANVVTAIDGIQMNNSRPFDIYNANGMLLRKNATDMNGLKPGLYIVNGKKVIH